MPEQIRQALEGSAHAPPADPAEETEYQRIFRRNREWVAESTAGDPEYFSRRAGGQHPTFLFIGCSDSRVPAELLTGAGPGDMFVHRNVANLCLPSDLNLLSVLQYAVDALKVKALVVCGHYGCGGVRASLNTEPNGFVDHWLGGVRDVAPAARGRAGDARARPERPARARPRGAQRRRAGAPAAAHAGGAGGVGARAGAARCTPWSTTWPTASSTTSARARPGEGDDGALRDAHDSEWLREFERRRGYAGGGAGGGAAAGGGGAPPVRRPPVRRPPVRRPPAGVVTRPGGAVACRGGARGAARRPPRHDPPGRGAAPGARGRRGGREPDRGDAAATPPRWLAVARELLDDHCGEAVRVAERARAAGVHPVHLARVFRRYLGCTPGDYLAAAGWSGPPCCCARRRARSRTSPCTAASPTSAISRTPSGATPG
jgi:carbonic anhydrase